MVDIPDLDKIQEKAAKKANESFLKQFRAKEGYEKRKPSRQSKKGKRPAREGKHINDQFPNKYDREGRFYLHRCFNCHPRGVENHPISVASGYCVWCGWDYKSEVVNK